MKAVFAIALCLFALAAAPQSAAQSVDPAALEKLRADEKAAKARAEKLAKEQAAVRAEIGKYKADLQLTAREAGAFERASRDIAKRLEGLTQNEAALSTALLADQTALSEFIAALQRIEVNPPPAATLAANDTKKTAMAGALVTSVSSQLQARTDALKARIAALDAVRSDIAADQSALDKNETALQKKRKRIKSLVGEKTKLDAKLGASRELEKKRAQDLAAKAKDLAELISQFERTAKDIVPRLKPKPGAKPSTGASRRSSSSRPSAPLDLPDGSARFADARGALRAPVQGRLKSGYGKGRQGVTVSTRTGAQVLSPYYGRVEFAGAFKTYGEVVILNVGDNYFILLTGLGEIFVNSGETVERGEPVGLMPFNAQNRSDLYIEFRKSGAPINPTPWLRDMF